MNFLNWFFSFLFSAPLFLSAIPYFLTKKEEGRNWVSVNMVGTFMVVLIFSVMAMVDAVSSSWLVQWLSGSLGNLYWGGAIDEFSSLYLLTCLWLNFFCKILISRDRLVDSTPQRRLFVYLDLFLIAAFISISATYFFSLFVGWQLLGVASYLLLSFSFESSASNQAAFTAFLYDKVGSAFLLLGGGMWIFTVGDKSFSEPEWALLREQAIGIFFFIAIYSRLLQVGVSTWILHAQEISSLSLAMVVNFLLGLPAFSLLGKLGLLEEPWFRTIAFYGGMATFVFAMSRALTEPLLKKIISYLNVAHWGVVLSFAATGMYKVSLNYLLALSVIQFVLFGIENILSSRYKEPVNLQNMVFPAVSSWLFSGLIILWAVSHTALLSLLAAVAGCNGQEWVLIGFGGIIFSVAIWRPAFVLCRSFLGREKEESVFFRHEEWILLVIGIVGMGISMLFFIRSISETLLNHISSLWITLAVGIGSGVVVWSITSLAFKHKEKNMKKTWHSFHQIFMRKAYLETFYDKSLVTTFKWVSASLSQKVDGFLIEEQAFEGTLLGLKKVQRFLSWVQHQTFSFHLFFLLLACLCMSFFYVLR